MLEELKAIRKRIEGGWCQNYFATNGTSPVPPKNSFATCFCLSGAIIAESKEAGKGLMSCPIYRRLMKEIEDFQSIANWNDHKGRTKQDVLDLLDKVILAETV